MPVLIVPGMLGTELSGSSGKLWLDLEHNFTDAGDQFMDPLQFTSGLQPSDPSVTVGDVLRKETILGNQTVFDYSYSLIQQLEGQGYVEGTDLFMFPYDWRYGVSQSIVDQLKQKIAAIEAQTGSPDVDVIAHSLGGLIVKKYVVPRIRPMPAYERPCVRRRAAQYRRPEGRQSRPGAGAMTLAFRSLPTAR